MKARLPKQNMGGAQNMNAMIRQAQKMQDEITTLQEDIENREFSATSGGGAVSVVVTGKKIIKSLTINKEVVDPEDVEMLQDLVISAINEAVNQVESTTETEMSKITGGVSRVCFNLWQTAMHCPWCCWQNSLQSCRESA